MTMLKHRLRVLSCRETGLWDRMGSVCQILSTKRSLRRCGVSQSVRDDARKPWEAAVPVA